MITLVFAESNDHWVWSESATYSNALNGANRVLHSGGNTYHVAGQSASDSGPTYYLRQSFLQFQYVHTSGQLVNSAQFRFRNFQTHGTNVSRNTNIYKYDYNTTPTIFNWRNPSQLNSLPLFGRFYDSNGYGSSSDAFASSSSIRRDFEAGSLDLRILLATSRQVTGIPPGTGVWEYNTFGSSRAGSNAPSLLVGSSTKSRMTTLLAAQIQLSDGSWFYLERDTEEEPHVMRARHMDVNGVESTIWTFPSSDPILNNDNFRSAQGVALARDNDDNVYMADPSWESLTHISVKAFKKQPGNNWIVGTNLSIPLPEETATNTNVQQVLMNWHDVAGGRLVVFCMRDHGRLGGTQDPYLLLDAQRVYNGQSGALVLSGRGGYDGFNAKPAIRGRWNPVNSTGTLVDMCNEAASRHRGYIIAGERSSLLGETGPISVGRYVIRDDGLVFQWTTFAYMDMESGQASYDPEAKIRVVSIGGHKICRVVADDRTDKGLTVDGLSFKQNEHGWTRFGSVQFDAEGIPTMPSGSTLAGSSNWDVVYFPPNNSLQVYYFDDTSSDNILMRTSVNLNTMLATQSEVVVDTIGVSTDTVHAIRVQRNEVVSDSVLVTVAYEDSSGDHHYDYVVDRINIAPTQPTLGTVKNFDGDLTSRDFTWTFADTNLVDGQTAFELEIVTSDTFTEEYATGKVVSANESHTVTAGSVTNNDSYLWRVRTWDVDDAVSPWSEYGSFATSSTGTVDIIDPDLDNDPDIFTEDYTIAWDVTGAGQDDYRIILTRTADESTFLDSGWVTSAAETHLVESLESDVEYLIEVTTRASMVESEAGYRLLTTHYSTVEEPLITLQTHTEYVSISVTNPEPRGDRPAPTVNRIYRRLAGTDGRFLYVGSCEPNEGFRDYTVVSNESYEYKARSGVEE